MALTTPIQNNIIGDIEAQLGQNIPILKKAVFRIIAFALAGIFIILYLFGTDAFKQRFAQTANSFWLGILGELVNTFRQQATFWTGGADVVSNVGTGNLDAGTQLVNNNTGIVYTVDITVPLFIGTVPFALTATIGGEIGNLNVGDIVNFVEPLAGLEDTAIITLGAITWSSQTSGTANALTGVAYGNNQYVTVGASGTILTSPFGINWTSRTSGTGNNLEDITYGNNQYVTVGGSGTILTSPDAITWTSRTSGTANALLDAVYGSSLYVTVGASGTILTSPDVITWTSRTSGTANALTNITYGNNQYVAVGLSGTILTSPDAITWTTQTSGTSNNLAGIIYNNDQYVTVGASGTILTSSDGITWTLQSSGTANDLENITYGNNQYVAVGLSGTILTSPDAITWTTQTSGTSNALFDIAYGNNQYVAVGASGTILISIGSIINGEDQEALETYRTRVIAAYQKRPQGGSLADYEKWGLEAPNAENIYVYADSGNPGKVDIYVEVDNQVDGIPTSSQLAIVEDYINFNPVTGIADRRPVTAEINMFGITRRIFDVEIFSLSPDTPELRTDIEDAISNILLTKEPFILGLSTNRNDTIQQGEIFGIVFAIAGAAGSTFNDLILSESSIGIDIAVLGEGEKAKLGTVTFS
jgi:uncharacterized phage protein gp47/JayE